jgi:hypothetical protein
VVGLPSASTTVTVIGVAASGSEGAKTHSQ